MLKKAYLKHFIFFLSLLAYNFDSYGGEFEDEAKDARRYERWLQQGYNVRPRVKAETPMFQVIQGSIKQGAADALTKSALNVLSRVLQIIPYSVNKMIAMIQTYAYKWSFGTTGLTARDMTKFSNRIHNLCNPLATTQVGNMRKTKRANVIESEQDNGQVIDANWVNDWRPELVSELEHIVTFLKNVLPCYHAAFQSIEASLVEKKLASILYALSTENNYEIQNYIIRLIGYIQKLIKLLDSFSSFDNAIEHADQTKRLLTLIRLTFEHISSFLTDGNVKGAGFQKMSDNVNNKRDIMDLSSVLGRS